MNGKELLFAFALELFVVFAGAPQSSPQFDGKWWGSTNSDERSGFINGVADCMTWSAHEKGFNATPPQLVGEITWFYGENPGSAELTIVDAWRVIGKKSSPKSSSQGQTWENPRW